MTTIAGPGARGMDDTLRRLFAGGTLAGLGDAELLERFASSRDELAFEALVRRHGPAVWAACRSVLHDDHDAEDAFQATFLILARRAPALWASGGSLGGWLYTVAHRVAARSIAEAARRRSRERRVARPDASHPDATRDDLGAAVHRELVRLPAKYREPVVLCDLEGRTHAQAAAELGRGEATVRRRLVEARALLRSRMARKGLAPALGGVGLLSAGRAEAAVPDRLATTLARAACGVSPDRAATAAAAALGARVLRGMLLARITATAAACLALAATGAAVFVLGEVDPPTLDARPQAPPAGPTSAPTARLRAEDEAGPEGNEPVIGRVVDPAGQPVPDARVYAFDERLLYHDRPPVDWVSPAEAPTGPDGHFRLHVAARDGEEGGRPTVVAFASGFGPAWTQLERGEAAEGVTLRLAPDDVPIEGRVLDLEGRPIAGVRVIPRDIFAPAGGDLSAYLGHLDSVVDNGDDAWAGLGRSLPLRAIEAEDLSAKTDAEGHFRLDGLGRDRVVALDFRGPTIAARSGTYVYARTRPGPTARFPMDRNQSDMGTFIVHGASVEHVAMPTRPVEGIVRDAETGAPIPGVTIVSEQFAGIAIRGRGDVQATSDAEGRYRLLGMPPGEGNLLRAEPAAARPYLGTEREVPGGPVAEPARVDFELTRGVTIRGRVTDASTGAPVTSRVEYFAFGDNPHLEGLRLSLSGDAVFAGDDGAFELVGLPGRGLVAVRDERDRFAVGRGAEAIEGLQDLGGLIDAFVTEPTICQAEYHHAIVAVTPPADAEELRCDIQLHPGRSVSGTVVGPDGEPIDGVEVTGIRAWTMLWNNGYGRLDSASFTLEALDPDRPRRVTFRHEGRDLIASLVVRGDEPGPLAVRLGPAAAVSGRLVDGRGRPKSHVDINVRGPDFGRIRGWVGRFAAVEVGDDGAFRVSGLVPGLSYELDVREGNSLTGEVASDLVLEPGESRDLGEVVVGEDG